MQGRMMAGSGAGAGDTSAGLAAVAWAREAVASGGAVDAAVCEAAAVLLGAVGAADVDAPPLAQRSGSSALPLQRRPSGWSGL